MDWTVGLLDPWTIGLFFFWDYFFENFWTILSGGGEVDHKYLRRGGVQFISTQEGVGGRLLLLRGVEDEQLEW